MHLLFQEGKSLHESIQKVSENLTKLREEINRTQRHMLRNVSFVEPLKQLFLFSDLSEYDSMTSTWNVL